MHASDTTHASVRDGRKDLLLTIGFCVLAAAALIAAGLILASKRWMWMDELLTWQLVTAPSWGAMLHAAGDQVDTMPPLYFILARAWITLTGTSEFSLRLLSILLVTATYLITFLLLKRTANLLYALTVTTAVFFLSDLLFTQLTELRYYPLLLLLSAVATALYFRLSNGRTSPRWLFVLNAIVHGALVTTHLFGFLTSTALMISFLVTAGPQRRAAARQGILSSLAGWLFFLPWIPAQLRQMEVAQPYSWIPLPDMIDLIAMPFTMLPDGRPRYVLIAVFILLVLLPRRLRAHIEEETLTRMAVSGGLLLLLPILTAYILSTEVVSIFIPRYFIAGIVGWILLLPPLAVWIRRAIPIALSPRPFLWLTALSIATAILLSFPAAKSLQTSAAKKPGSLSNALYPNLPVVTESPHAYLPRFHYAEDRSRIFYVLDRASAFNLRGVLNGPTDYHHMLALERNFPGHNILPGDSILARFDRFLLIDEAGRLWSERVLEDDRRYDIREITESLKLLTAK